MQYGILGSSDLDQAGSFKANLMAALVLKLTYNFVHTGSYKSKLLQKRFQKQMEAPDPYNRAFVSILGRDKYDMSFIAKESIRNQFRSDLTTPLPAGKPEKRRRIRKRSSFYPSFTMFRSTPSSARTAEIISAARA